MEDTEVEVEVEVEVERPFPLFKRFDKFIKLVNEFIVFFKQTFCLLDFEVAYFVPI